MEYKLCWTCRHDGAMGVAVYCPACARLQPWWYRLFMFFCWSPYG